MVDTGAAATTSGALTGAAAAEAQTRTRLESLLFAVARQEPRLRWVIGEHDDGITLLTTDLASGWIPPHVEIPTGLSLLCPARRRSGLEALLGDCVSTAAWMPGQYLPPRDAADPVRMSLRARCVDDIDEIHWELTQATNWRDGLPRLAHTLARAAIAGTGVLDSEIELLHEHLDSIATEVLACYPDAIPTDALVNWQLLAAISALVNGRRTELHYHFSWFQALNMSMTGGR